MTTHAKRRSAAVLGTAALLVALAAGASEVRAVMWWSAVVLPGGPYQRFAGITAGEIRIGRRGTAGFFTRAIAHPGWRITRPNAVLSDFRERSWWPRKRSARQTRAWIFPLWPAAAVLAGASAVAWTSARRHTHGTCSRCGYDLAGITHHLCPECGAAVSSPTPPCASSTSQPG